MKLSFLHTIKYGVIALAVTLFFSCKDNFKAIKKIGISENEPLGIAENMNAKRTDSGRVVANLLSPKMYDFGNRKFGYSEFPDGLTLYVYDTKNQKSTIISDYAIRYEGTDLIDLQGNVIVATAQNDTLFAEQLYYDQSKEWVFTNLPVTYKSADYITHGNGFDSDKDFTKAEVLEISGQFAVLE
ncbi:LPS export ABC transporter periplasmic protein LptC [Bizionia paragorgiae]|uniref:LPS export ABC transporter protein LptC n=1 Tax=Bizionia paragorgiae TaxID=283786 RepID=A0A1H4AM46_BIZPA|nr:LPS export ABC transporter periplasmic protein LptC [Bizionia paragorgiae]MDX1270269.1 LPS export ABC transporter periplasmic protein LptC [Bizionia paragorgiae]SEA36858.1 LPS export ABC transporter protein LptC [Bizionia paragorgiae]